MAMLAAIVLVRFSKLNADKIHLAMTNAFFGDHFFSEMTNCLGGAL